MNVRKICEKDSCKRFKSPQKGPVRWFTHWRWLLPSLIEEEEEEEEEKRGKGRVLSHGVIRWKDRNNFLQLSSHSTCVLWLAHAHTHKRIIYDKNELQGILKELIKHFKYKILSPTSIGNVLLKEFRIV